MTRSTQQLAVDTIKALAMDGVEAAQSGHPGMPMGMADIAVVLWARFLKVDPSQPSWPDRDRFVVSNGHGSMLLYALLHLSGFAMSLEDLRRFRRLDSPTPGHLERDTERGIEVTTGPLGQGFGMGVGLAIAEEHLRAVFGPELVDHRTYALVSDGDLMEGISSEAASLAGHLGLGKLCYVYDNNHITIEGSTQLAFSEDVGRRLQAVGWSTEEVDGHDRMAVEEAVQSCLLDQDRPSLIIAHTHIAHGAPTKQDSAEAHGNPLGAEEVAATKRAMGWPEHDKFLVPDAVREYFGQVAVRGGTARQAWEARRQAAFATDPGLAQLWQGYWEPSVIKLKPLEHDASRPIATRRASGLALNQLAATVPNLLGGAADLAPSTNTLLRSSTSFSHHDRKGRNFHFGIREHGMGAAVNGMAVHGGLRPFGATFLVFSDYMRPSVRVSALMHAPSIWIYTHDSVFLGEDGPTHQPIEHLASLRAMPNLWVLRPADLGETAEAWEVILNRAGGPSCLVLSRQDVPVLERQAGGVQRGGYVLADGDDLVIIATGSEVWVALETARLLGDAGYSARVVSLPCWELFFEQDEDYRASVLGRDLPRVSLEAAATFGWERITGAGGLQIGIDRFGASAPWKEIAEALGFTPTAVSQRIRGWMEAS